jgi:hypothetical protein
MNEKRHRKKKHTSVDVVRSAAQSMRGSTLTNSWGLISTSSLASSASLGWRGNESDEDLHVLTAQVKKLRVRTFILKDVQGEILLGLLLLFFFLRNGSNLRRETVVVEVKVWIFFGSQIWEPRDALVR